MAGELSIRAVLFFHSIFLFYLSNLDRTFASKADFEAVTCGSVLKLYSSRQNIRLHSHDVKYGSGSGQQSVTGSDSVDDHNSYWTVRGKHGSQCQRGAPVKCGEIIRLQHLATKRNLHSHLFQSPMSRNQEVSAFGENGDGDTGDNWKVICDGDHWKRDEKIRFKHADTGNFLHVTNEQFGRPIFGQREIVGYYSEDPGNLWSSAEGIYVRMNQKK